MNIRELGHRQEKVGTRDSWPKLEENSSVSHIVFLCLLQQIKKIADFISITYFGTHTTTSCYLVVAIKFNGLIATALVNENMIN